MAIKSRFAVPMGEVFPHGAYVVSEVAPVRDFEKSQPGRPVQQLDKETGLPVWSVSVLDADPEARSKDKTVVVKIAATHQPVPPEAAAGLPFRPVEFEGVTVTPYVAENGGRPRVAYSIRATGMRAPGGHGSSSGGRGKQQSGQDGEAA
ncbi:plasmid replication, integration and excision activator [Pseudonocardia sp. C8]|uniref:plasmid replication, integration and excision activator n=1 Tax=Pseudonocardia sp. C8 TaxID=2762759 RepID=UPI00164260F5|nr:plasmid replication, integration and excision activator [Pseudonocardia sp. C8]MBC3191466.1 plasmid replication, integration and excision activator [Pseudonocardia sp. C8]